MARDPAATLLTIGFPGGSLTAPRGTLTAIFGPALINFKRWEEKTINRDSHQRRVVIGGPQTAVKAATYKVLKNPQGARDGSSGGEPISLLLNGEWWEARLHGSHQALNRFLRVGTWQSENLAYWQSERGTPYGPFNPEEDTTDTP